MSTPARGQDARCRQRKQSPPITRQPQASLAHEPQAQSNRETRLPDTIALGAVPHIRDRARTRRGKLLNRKHLERYGHEPDIPLGR